MENGSGNSHQEGKARRQFLAVLGAFGVGAVGAQTLRLGDWIPSVQAAEGGKAVGGQVKAMAEIARATADCVRAGEACVAHCAKELAAGNQSMANCNNKVHVMIAICRAMTTLASFGSEHAARLAALCAVACHDCAKACAEHEEHFAHGMHLACKECMEACNVAEKACKKIA